MGQAVDKISDNIGAYCLMAIIIVNALILAGLTVYCIVKNEKRRWLKHGAALYNKAFQHTPLLWAILWGPLLITYFCCTGNADVMSVLTPISQIIVMFTAWFPISAIAFSVIFDTLQTEQ